LLFSLDYSRVEFAAAVTARPLLSICHSRGGGNPGLVIKEIKYKKNGYERIYYSTGFPPSRE
jgi:hypothetical protein